MQPSPMQRTHNQMIDKMFNLFDQKKPEKAESVERLINEFTNENSTLRKVKHPHFQVVVVQRVWKDGGRD